MTPGTLLALLLGALLLQLVCHRSTGHRLSGLRQVITRNLTGVWLDPNTPIYIVEEQTCSAALVRLTCRSVYSFMYILEARFQPNRTDACLYDRNSWCMNKSLFATIRSLQQMRAHLKSNYPSDPDSDPLDFRSTVNKRCAGKSHCRFRVTSDHPEALFWRPANIRVKYACIPEASVHKYCNSEIKVPPGEGGFLQTPGYPLYYLGGMTCEWKFRARLGQRIVITFHDLNIREHESDGSCVDLVRIGDNGNTIYETCGTAAGVRVVSNSNFITLNLVTARKINQARGFFLQYQVLGCPDVAPPSGSYVSNGTLESRTFLCRARGASFADTGLRTRTVRCKNGQWERRIDSLPGCTKASSWSASTVPGSEDAKEVQVANILDLNSVFGIGAGSYNTHSKTVNRSLMDLQPKTTEEGDYVIDIILPTLLIALLFVGNAFIVYIIFQYRKRKAPQTHREEVALSTMSNGAANA